MTNQGKNGVIAKWLGFRQMRLDELPDTMRHESNLYNRFMTPQGEHRGVPDFTDLTMLFKWCVPKLKAECYHIMLQWTCEASEYYDGSWQAFVGCDNNNTAIYNHDPDPGEALREVILSLIRTEDGQG